MKNSKRPDPNVVHPSEGYDREIHEIFAYRMRARE